MKTNNLQPEFKSKIEELIKVCRENNMLCRIVDTYRTKDEHTAMYVKGRTSNGQICTCGSYPNNYHCWGLAVDVYLIPDFPDKFGEIVKSLGLTWGGENREFINPYHVEFPMYSLKELRLKYGTYKEFRLTWDPTYKDTPVTPVIKEKLLQDNGTLSFITRIQTAYNTDFSKCNQLTVNGVFDEQTVAQLNKMIIMSGKQYEIIKIIQILFTKIGYPIIINGKYDDSMVSLIKKYQKKNKFAQTGIINSTLIKSILLKFY